MHCDHASLCHGFTSRGLAPRGLPLEWQLHETSQAPTSSSPEPHLLFRSARMHGDGSSSSQVGQTRAGPRLAMLAPPQAPMDIAPVAQGSCILASSQAYLKDNHSCQAFGCTIGSGREPFFLDCSMDVLSTKSGSTLLIKD